MFDSVRSLGLLFVIGFLLLGGCDLVGGDEAEVPSLFRTVPPDQVALDSVGTNRLETLKEDSIHASIRVAYITDSLLQRTRLKARMGSDGGVLAPAARPIFRRKSGEGSSRPYVDIYIQRDELEQLSSGATAWSGTARPTLNSDEELGDVTIIHGADGDVSATIRVEDEYVEIRPLSQGLHALVEVNEGGYSQPPDCPRC
jgi:hypothetical protein